MSLESQPQKSAGKKWIDSFVPVYVYSSGNEAGRRKGGIVVKAGSEGLTEAVQS